MMYPDLSTQFLEWGRYWLNVYSGISILGENTPLYFSPSFQLCLSIFLIYARSNVNYTAPATSKRSFTQFLLFSNNDASSLTLNLAISLGIRTPFFIFFVQPLLPPLLCSAVFSLSRSRFSLVRDHDSLRRRCNNCFRYQRWKEV